MSESRSDEVSSAKRRKIRKGTTSCWECKRRKVRCSLVDSPESVCRACQRRGAKCITQDLPDDGRPELASTPQATASDRSSDSGVTASTQNTHTTTPTRTIPPSSGYAQAPQNQATISQELYSSLPSHDDIQVLCKLGADVPITFHAFVTLPYPVIEEDGLDETTSLLEIPAPETHPVLIAKYMLQVAMILQSLDFKQAGKHLTALSDAPQLMAKRLAETAIRLVTSRDELLGTVEGVECVMMEGSYQANCGNFRPAWVAFRKAMSLAQVMGIHHPGHGPLRFLGSRRKFDPSYLWFRIVYIDRFMGLMVGLPQGSMDRTMASEGALAADTPLGRLDRLHCVIASRILERNESDLADIDTVRAIDSDLQKAADAMPAGWWMVPDSVGQPDGHHWDILRLVTQLYHYGLINQLHLPFALCFINTSSPQLHEYSETICVNASREILTRYAALSSSNRVAHSCRVVDFFTLSCTLTLLLPHLRQHGRASNENTFNPLVHQRHTDRTLVQKAIDNLQKVAWIAQDRIIANSADLVSRLLAVEDEAARGRIYTMHHIGTPEMVAQETENGPPPKDGNKGLRFCVPGFGFVKIIPGAAVSGFGSRDIKSGTEPVQRQLDLEAPGFNGIERPELNDSHNYILGSIELPGETQPWYASSGLSGTEDWSLHGLDMTFFDCLFQQPTVLDGNLQVL